MARGALVLTVAVLTGCAPVYSFRLAPQANADTVQCRQRLAALVTREGFQSIGKNPVMSGDIGCGRNAEDRVGFSKEWTDGEFHRIAVYEFTSDESWRIVIVSTKSADAGAAQVQDAIEREFATEIRSGDLTVHTGLRLALE